MVAPLPKITRDHAISARPASASGGAPGQRSDQQSAKEPARSLSALPNAARSAAPFGAALDYLPPALGRWRSLPRSVPGNDRRIKRTSPGEAEVVSEACRPVERPSRGTVSPSRPALGLPWPAKRPRSPDRQASLLRWFYCCALLLVYNSLPGTTPPGTHSCLYCLVR